MLTDTEVKAALSARGSESESITIHRSPRFDETEGSDDIVVASHYDNGAPSYRYVPNLSDTLFVVCKTAAGTVHAEQIAIRDQVGYVFTCSNLYIEQKADDPVLQISIHLYKPLKEIGNE